MIILFDKTTDFQTGDLESISKIIRLGVRQKRYSLIVLFNNKFTEFDISSNGLLGAIVFNCRQISLSQI